MGPQEDYIEAVVTCEGDFHDPKLQDRLQRFQQRLESLLLEDGKKQLILKKVEPWNSVRVTFNIPKHAALRLKQLAEQGSASLRQIGVLGVQIQGDRLVSLTVAAPNNQRAELIINTHDEAGQAGTSGPPPSVVAAPAHDPGLPSSSEELGSPGASMEVTRKNIEEYLRQGFGSILAPSSAGRPLGPGSSMDLFKGREGGPKYAGDDGVAGPSGLSDFTPRPPLPGSRGHGGGAFSSVGGGMLTPGQLGPKTKSPADPLVPQPQPQPQPQQHIQQLPQQQQVAAQGTALPQTAAVGYNMMDLPPPPPYPHGHGKGSPNNVSRKRKKGTSSSPLLINLLQTDPLAGTNNIMATPGTGEKKKKKRMRPKEKIASASDPSDGQFPSSGISSVPLDSSQTPSSTSLPAVPSTEEMSAVLHRRVSPIPLPTPSVIGFGSVTSAPDHRLGVESFKDRQVPTASAALVSLAKNQRTSVEPEHSSDTIINPYTGHLEPRDSADLSPGREQRKSPSSSLPQSAKTGNVAVESSLPASFPTVAAGDTRTGMGDTVHIGLGSFHPETTVPSSSIGFPSSSITSVSLPSHAPSVSRTALTVQHAHGTRVQMTRTPSPLPSGTSGPHVYARHPVDPSHKMSRPPSAGLRRPSYPLLPDAANVNSSVSVNSVPSSHSVSSGPAVAQLDSLHGTVPEGGDRVPVPHPVLGPQSSVLSSVAVSIGEVQAAGVERSGGGLLTSGGGRQHPVPLSTAQPVKQTVGVVSDVPPGAPVATPLPVQQNDSLKLLNSSSASVGAVQRLAAAETASSAASHSPAGSKPPSDGDDSNHSPVSQIGPSSLLDANGTKVENHDSGVGSSSERSDDMTPSEAGDGEFHNSVTATTEPSASDSSNSKAAVGVKKSVLNCEKTPSSAEQQSLTVGFVQASQHAADLCSKENIKHTTDSLLLGEKDAVTEALGELSHLAKSADGLLPVVSQVALAAHKANASVSRPDRVSSPQQQRLIKKQLAMAKSQVTGVLQNGPLSLPPGIGAQHSPAVRLPNNSHPTVQHPTGITVSPSPGHVGVSAPPVSTSLALQQPTTSVAGNTLLNHPPNSLPNNLGLRHPVITSSSNHQPPAVAPNSQGMNHLSSPGPTNQAARLPASLPGNHLPVPASSSNLTAPHLSVASSVSASHHSASTQHQVVSAPSSQPTHHPPICVASSQGMHVAGGHGAISQSPGGGHHFTTAIPSCRAQAVLRPGPPTLNSQIPGAMLNPKTAGRGTRPVSLPQALGHLTGGTVPATSCMPMPSISNMGASHAGSSSSASVSTSRIQRTMSGNIVSPGLPPGSVSSALVSVHRQQHSEQGSSGHGHVTVASKVSSAYPHGRLSNGPTSGSFPSHGTHSLPSFSAVSSNPTPPTSFPFGFPAQSSASQRPLNPIAVNHSSLQTQHLAQKTTVVVPSSQTLVSTQVSSAQLLTSQPSGSTTSTVLPVSVTVPVPVSADLGGKHLLVQATAKEVTDGGSPPRPVKQASPRQMLHPPIATVSLPANNIFCDLDLGSMASELEAGGINDIDLADTMFDPNEDLALLMEPGLRHSTVNGSEGASTETRGGSNITSMYTKRSSPINVNMLNHMYAPGLPKPRSLTESVQRLVKPLPNPENSLLPGRTCKSPGASSRHNSNGSTSPGRAGQGGARSPGASAGSAVSRNLSLDKVASSLMSVASVHPSVPPAAQVMADSNSVNCVYTTTSLAAASLPIIPQLSMANGPQTSMPAGHITVQGGASMVTTPFSAAAVSSAQPPRLQGLPHSAAVSAMVPSQPQGDSAILSHSSAPPGFPSALYNHSSSGCELPASFPPAVPALPSPRPSPVPSVSVPLPGLLPPPETGLARPSVSQLLGSSVSNSPAMPSAVLAAVSSIPVHRAQSESGVAVCVANPLQSPVSVCNTLPGLDSVPSSQRVLASLASSSSFPSMLASPLSVVPSLSSSLQSSASLVPSLNQQQQQQHRLPSTTPSPNPRTVPAASIVPSSCDLSTDSTNVTVADQGSAYAASSFPTPLSAADAPKLSYRTSESQMTSMGIEAGRSSSAVTVAKSNGTTAYGHETISGHSAKPTHEFTKAAATAAASVSYMDSTTGLQSVVSSAIISATVTGSGETATKLDSRRVDEQLASRSLSQDIPRASSEAAMAKSPWGSDSLGHWAARKAGEQEEDGQKIASSMPPLHHQEGGSSWQWAQSENHSKPPLLHPTPPLTLPTVISSATPPPPPLTPVLQDSNRKDATPYPNRSTSPLSTNKEDLMSTFSGREATRLALPVSLVSDSIASDKEEAEPSTSSDDHVSVEINTVVAGQSDAAADHSLSGQAGEEFKSYTGGFPPLSLSSDEASLQMRRATRKRKTNHSESDSSTTSEPAPKLSCVEKELSMRLMAGEENSVGGIAPDNPPKLHREGKRHASGGTDRKEEEYEKKAEDKGGKKEDKDDEKAKNSAAPTGKNILEATPEEVAKKLAAVTSGSKRKIHYTYVLEKAGQSYFDTPVLSGRTRSQGFKGSKEGPVAAPGTGPSGALASAAGSQSTPSQAASITKDDGGEGAGSKRSKRSLRAKEGAETNPGKRKRGREPR